MISSINNHFFKLQVKLLICFKPSLLFEKINNLDWYKSTLHHWIDDLNLTTNNKVLEVGCATGSLSRYIAGFDCNISGIDSSENMIKIAENQSDNIDFIIGNALELPVDDESFDIVVASSLVNIVTDKKKVVSELTRVCQKGGIVTVLVPSAGFNDNDLHSLQERSSLIGFSRAAMVAWHKMPPKMNYTELFKLFEESGLVDQSKKYYLDGMVVSVSGRKA